MVSLITSSKAQKKIAENMRDLRLEKGFTQEGLSKRSGVSLSSLRKFEQKGAISLESFFKLAMVLGNLERFIEATKPSGNNFSSIDDVLNNKENKKPERGWRK
ncbi:XRE family transcriptional regulator [Flavobacterium beibuense F44-8]|uniref:XRE family transcriptional regulator n=1 Tax=Flavobacterium beibuense F44-8 TaxID=1406840 RepID=A0A0A2LHW2_9FLAO|nr:helix-turn-helix transcriptional regulator [Flavobacterium beibuense]KGO78806.1 XRE family transcriptional regulator [Flavobacterium beibuense F44-8]